MKREHLLFKEAVCKHGISIRYTFTLKYRKTDFLTNLKSKIKTKIIKMKREHLLFKEAVCKNRISLSLNFPLNILGDVNYHTSRGKPFHYTLLL